MLKKVLIIGGGASGMMAAFVNARGNNKVTLIEHGSVLGKKILATGNGRCNFTNLNLSKDDYNGNHPSFVENALKRFDQNALIKLFETYGLKIAVKRDGYVYPYSNQAVTVRDFLVKLLEEQKVHIVLDCYIKDILPSGGKEGKYTVVTNEFTDTFDYVIFACGGKASPQTGSDGSVNKILQKLNFQMEKQYPSLVKLYTKDAMLKTLQGVRMQARVTLKADGEYVKDDIGEVQFTKDAVSGIVVFQLSHEAIIAYEQGKNVSLWLDLLPEDSYDDILTYMDEVAQVRGQITVKELLGAMLPAQVTEAVMGRLKLAAGLKYADLNEKQKDKLIHVLKCFVFEISGYPGFDQAQVTMGGVAIDELNENMESVKHPGIYIVGELMDIDGKCGGYNLQWAFTSGYIAAMDCLK